MEPLINSADVRCKVCLKQIDRVRTYEPTFKEWVITTETCCITEYDGIPLSNNTIVFVIQTPCLDLGSLDMVFRAFFVAGAACECGGSKVGYKPRQPGHSFWCPAA